MTLNERAESIVTRNDLVSFIRDLMRTLREEPADWENGDLPAFLEGMAGWIEDMDGYYENRGEPPPEQPNWRTLGHILLAARVYE